MSASLSLTNRFITSLTLTLSPPLSPPSAHLRYLSHHRRRRHQLFSLSTSIADSTMPRGRGRGIRHKEERWQVKSSPAVSSSATEGGSIDRVDGISSSLRGVSLAEHSGQAHAPVEHIQFGGAVLQNNPAVPGQKAIWKPKFHGTGGGGTAAPVEEVVAEQKGSEPGSGIHEKSNSGASLGALFRGKLLENFTVDKNTYSLSQIRATFYPKFENEKSDLEIRTRMIEMVDRGLATVEVTLKHSGSLFMYAGHKGGAYAKNSFGNIYTAVGVFVLGRTFREAWGVQASKKQAEFNEYLERNKICISMELVTAVLGDHGQRPREDYVVVTAVTELGVGKPKFYSTPEIIAFCRKWRLPTNHVWLFSTRKSVTSFFAVFDALCEEGTATSVCKAFDALCEYGMATSSKALDSEVANISIPGSIDHIKVQGEILEGLVARVVSPESLKQMKEVLREYPLPPIEGAELDLGPSLRQICAANRSDEKQQIKALLEAVGTSFCPDYVDWLGKDAEDAHSRTADKSAVTKFLQAQPADYSTRKLQEVIRLMKDKRFPAAFKCYYNLHKAGSMSKDDIHYKMVIHVHRDTVFKRYQQEMRHDPGLWPLYRGFFVDVNLFKGSKDRATETSSDVVNNINGNSDATGADSLADQDANLMVKLKFLTYKLRTFLIRNGLSILFKDGPAAYKTYYLRQMKIWGTSVAKQKEMIKMLDEWAVYITRKCGPRQLRSDIYLSEAEPFLEHYARRNAANQALIGAAGNLVRSEDFLAIVGDMDEEGDLQEERDMERPALSPTPTGVAHKGGLIVFFPGIPGCAKSALCKELLNAGGFGDDRPVQSLMGDLIKGRYWQKVADVCKKKPNLIMLADKNAPNEEVWQQIEHMCVGNRACAVPVVPDSAGTDSNPFSLDALVVFMYRVLQRANHPGNLDNSSPNAGYVLLMFYHLYEGKSRSDFEAELIERFGSLVKIPLLRPERACLPDSIRSKLEEGISLYRLHTKQHGRLESTKGSYAKNWAKWEKEMRETLSSNAEYLNSIQVPFESAVNNVLDQLKEIAQGDYTPPSTDKKRFQNIVFACVSLPLSEIHGLINDFTMARPEVEAFFKDKNLTDQLRKAHVTLAHKRSHGLIAVVNYAQFLNRKVPVEMTALLFSDKLAALEARIGSIDGERIIPQNEWPHVTLWTAQGVPPKEANTLPQLVSQGKASRVDINPPMSITGEVMFS